MKFPNDFLTPQAGDFMSVFQRVKFPLTWLVKWHVAEQFLLHLLLVHFAN
jgi:hypothetical protein